MRIPVIDHIVYCTDHHKTDGSWNWVTDVLAREDSRDRALSSVIM